MTSAEWLEYAAGCDLNDPTGNVRLLMHEHTPAIINPVINERMAKNRSCNYFVQMFETGVQADGQSDQEINRTYHPSYVPKSFSFLAKSSQPCDPLIADACSRHFCEIPSGGMSTMNQGQWFSWGLKTKPYCLQNFRNIPNFIEWLAREADDRAKAAAVHMELFWLQVFLLTAGHKIVLEGKQVNGGMVPFQNGDPRNPLGGYKYNWMAQNFPELNDPNNILPLDVAVLQKLGRNWSQNSNTAPVAFNGEGNGLYTLWIGDDWRQQEVDRFDDFARLFGTIENEKMLEGYQFEEGSKTTFGRFILESRFNLPRFAVDAVTGGVIMVQDEVPLEVDVGYEYIRNQKWLDAPIRLAVAPTRDQAVVLTRPALQVHGNGIPIPVVPSAGGWYPVNHHDKDCNPNQLLPHWESWNEMGYRPKNPDGSMAIMYRARNFLMVPQNFCDLAPMFTVETPDTSCSLTTIGCDNKKFVQNSITALRIGQTDIRCAATKCGSDLIYGIKVDALEPLHAGSQTIDADCGTAITVIVEDGEGSFREVQATLIDNEFGYPFGKYSIEFASALDDDDCIRAVRPNGSHPTYAIVQHSLDKGAALVKFATETAIVGLVVGGACNVKYYNEAGTLLGTIVCEATIVNQNLFQYTLSSLDAEFAAVPDKAWAGNIDTTKTRITKL